MQKELGIDEGKLIQAIRLFIRQVRPFMARREGRTDYFYEAFKLAAKERYKNNIIHYNQVLTDYFKEQADPEVDLSFKGKNIRDFNELPYHLKESKKTSCLEKVLSTYLWIKNKSELSDIQNTINDYGYIDVENEDNYHIELIRDTLVMSLHVLKKNIKNNLPSQLWGRLKEMENPQIKEFLIEIEKYTDYPWLKPCHHMHSPGEALKVTLTGHTNRVKSVCFSPDGKYVASGAEWDKTLRIWDWAKQKETQLKGDITGVTGVNSVCFSPDGKYVVLGADEIVRVWDWEKQKEIKLKGHTHNYINSACFSPDGKYVASGGDRSIRVWDWRRQKEIIKLEGHTSWINHVCFSPDGRYIVSDAGENDRGVRVWDWEKQKEIAKLEGLRDVCFSPDGKYIVSGADDNDYIVRVWDWEKQKEIVKLGGHTAWVGSVCFSPDGKYVVSGSGDNTIRIWDWKNQKEIVTLEGHTDRVDSVHFSPDGKYVVSGAADHTIRVWDIKTQKEITKLIGHTDKISTVCFSPDSKYVVSGAQDWTVRIWDWKNQKEMITEKYIGVVGSVCFSPDGKYVVSESGDYTIRVWDWEKQKEVTKLEKTKGNITTVCLSPDGKYVAIGSLDHTIRIWDWKNQKEICVLGVHHRGYARHVCFSPDGKYIISGASDGIIRIWDWKNQKEIARLVGHTKGVESVCFSSDGKYIISGALDQTIRIWAWGKREEVQKQLISLNTESEINSCALSNNNRKIIAGGASGQILIYDIENLPVGIPIVASFRDLDNNLDVRCRYCGKTFNILEDKLGKIVYCSYCNEELQVNDFIVKSIIFDDGIESQLIDLLDDGKINEAENLLFEELEVNFSNNLIEDARKFYEKLRTYNSSWLSMHNFSLQEAEDGWKDFEREFLKRRDYPC
ncbi:MAG: DUF6483 family protein [Tannerella sp.]|jgi:WD40 repeat protein|nr:DUF6483 family protein [Tannerella sp.]